MDSRSNDDATEGSRKDARRLLQTLERFSPLAQERKLTAESKDVREERKVSGRSKKVRSMNGSIA